MIAWLKGKILEAISESEVIFKTGDVGYKVSLLSRDLAKIIAASEPSSIYVHSRVKEDSLSLYGFLLLKDLTLFEKLVSTHGVGPSLAQAILEKFNHDEFKKIVETQDIERLTLVPGIGKKTATRLLVELKPDFELKNQSGNPKLKQVQEVLINLGYSSDEISEVLLFLDEKSPLEELIKHALKMLAKRL